MSTLLDLKTIVATQLGADNASTSVSKRDKIINIARREYYSLRAWTFLRKSAAVTITAQVGSLPTDYNDKFEPLAVYTYSGTTKYAYQLVDWDDLPYYPTSEYAFAVDKFNNQIKINQTTVGAVTLDYTYLPADHPIDVTEDSVSEPAPDITPIGLLAIAKWWLSSERATGKYQLFKDEYEKAVGQAVMIDNRSKGLKAINPQRVRLNTGYRGRAG